MQRDGHEAIGLAEQRLDGLQIEQTVGEQFAQVPVAAVFKPVDKTAQRRLEGAKPHDAIVVTHALAATMRTGRAAVSQRQAAQRARRRCRHRAELNRTDIAQGLMGAWFAANGAGRRIAEFNHLPQEADESHADADGLGAGHYRSGRPRNSAVAVPAQGATLVSSEQFLSAVGALTSDRGLRRSLLAP